MHNCTGKIAECAQLCVWRQCVPACTGESRCAGVCTFGQHTSGKANKEGAKKGACMQWGEGLPCKHLLHVPDAAAGAFCGM